ncbi:MAG TPA: response regulator [Candidatus Angelobacter sp.]|nr:response regulator [Candidatus Angelobacter sp.]
MRQPKVVILCVDDEENPLILRKLVLQKAGYDVVTANSGRKALEVLQSQPIDLVLSDLLMPGMTGTELARRIKDLHPKLPVVLVSGVNEIPPEASCADLFISKVEGPISLCENISAVLGRNNSDGAGRTQ